MITFDSQTQFMACIAEAYAAGYTMGVAKVGEIKMTLSRRAADKLYGKAFMNKVVERGFAQSNKKGENTSKAMFDRAKLDELYQTQNRWMFVERTCSKQES